MVLQGHLVEVVLEDAHPLLNMLLQLVYLHQFGPLLLDLLFFSKFLLPLFEPDSELVHDGALSINPDTHSCPSTRTSLGVDVLSVQDFFHFLLL